MARKRDAAGNPIPGTDDFGDFAGAVVASGGVGNQQERDAKAALQQSTQDYNRPYQTAVISNTNENTRTAKLKNNVYEETGMSEAKDKLRNNENITNLNIDFGRAMKQEALDSSRANTQHVKALAARELYESDLDRLAPSMSSDTNSTLQRHKDEVVDFGKQAKVKRVNEFKPFGVNTSGSDNSEFLDEGYKELGLPARRITDKFFSRAIPFAAATQAVQIKNALQKTQRK